MKKLKLKNLIAVLLLTIVFFNLINHLTAQHGQQVDGCDEKGFPLRYYIACANEGGFPVDPDNSQGFSWFYYAVDFICMLIPIAFIFWIFSLLKKKYNSPTNSFGIILRIAAILLYGILILIAKAQNSELIAYWVIIGTTLFLINIAQLLHSLNIKKNLLMYASMICYFGIICLWSKDFEIKRDFEYKGETIPYKHLLLNGSFHKLFASSYYSAITLDNAQRKRDAIDYFLFLQCEYYQEEINYTPRQREAIYNGSIKIIHSSRYSKGNLKDFILNTVNEEPYYSSYKYYTQQPLVTIENIINHRWELFHVKKNE